MPNTARKQEYLYTLTNYNKKMVAFETSMWVKLVKLVCLLGNLRNSLSMCSVASVTGPQGEREEAASSYGLQKSKASHQKWTTKTIAATTSASSQSWTSFLNSENNASVRSVQGHERPCTMRAFSLWLCRQPLQTMTPKQNISKSSGLFPKRHTLGVGGTRQPGASLLL